MKKSHLPPSTYDESESEEQDDNENMENLALVCDRAASNSKIDQVSYEPVSVKNYTASV